MVNAELTIERDQDVHVLFEDEMLRVSWLDQGNSDKVLICFTDAGLELGHVGQVMAAVKARPEQFVRTARHLHCSAIFVTDKTVSWGNNVDFDKLADLIHDKIADKRVTILGVSMGGFNAIAATKHINAELCLAFCPQFSVEPKIMPREHRYDAFVAKIDTFRIPSLVDCFNDRCAYYTFNGSQGTDRYHWERFPVKKNARHYVFPEIDHRVARELRNRDVLVALISGCMAGREPGLALSGKVAFFIHELDKEGDLVS